MAPESDGNVKTFDLDFEYSNEELLNVVPSGMYGLRFALEQMIDERIHSFSSR